MAAENYVITASDLAPAISIDLANRLAGNINALRDLLGITDIQPVPVGTSVKQYKLTVGTLHPQAAEGDVIPLTDVTREAISNITVGLTPYRKSTTIQAIQAVGRDLAINDTDAALVSKIQGTIKDAFYTSLATGSGTVTGATLQTALANAWGAIETYYADIDASPIHFVSVADVAGYLGSASITLQTAFGMSYIENFLGLGTVVIAPGLDAGEFYSTAKISSSS